MPDNINIRRTETDPERERRLARNPSAVTQTGLNLSDTVLETANELDSVDRAYGTILNTLDQRSQTAFDQARSTLEKQRNLESVPDVVANILAFFGDDDYNRDVQRLNLEEQSLNLQEIGQQQSNALQLRSLAIEGVRRRLETASTQFDISTSIASERRAEAGELRAQQAASNEAVRLSMAQETHSMNTLVTKTIPSLTDEELENLVANPNESELPIGLVQRELAGRQSDALALRTAAMAVEQGDLQLAEFYKEQFLNNATLNSLTELRDNWNSPEGRAIRGQLGISLQQVNSTIGAREETARKQSQALVDLALQDLRIASESQRSDQNITALIASESLDGSTIAQIADLNDIIVSEQASIEQQLAAVQTRTEIVQNAVDAAADNYSNDKNVQNAVRDFHQRGGTFGNVSQALQVASADIHNPNALAGTVFSDSWEFVSTEFNDLEANKFQISLPGEDEFEGPRNFPVDPGEISNADILSRAYKVVDSNGTTADKLAIGELSLDYVQQSIVMLAAETELFRGFVDLPTQEGGLPRLNAATRRLFVTDQGVPSVAPFINELMAIDTQRKITANQQGTVVASVLDVYLQFLGEDTQYISYLNEMVYPATNMQQRAHATALGLFNTNGVAGTTYGRLRANVMDIVNQQTSNVASVIADDERTAETLRRQEEMMTSPGTLSP